MGWPADESALRESYARDGYVLLRACVARDTVVRLGAALQDEVARAPKAVSPFKTAAPGSAAELLTSSLTTRAFTAGKGGAVLQVGHGLHDDGECAPVFHEFCYSDDLFQLLRALGLRRPRIVQSKAVLKPPHAGGRATTVPPHADATFIYTEPLSGCALWMPIDEATPANGCLEVLPGSHARFALTERFEADHERA